MTCSNPRSTYSGSVCAGSEARWSRRRRGDHADVGRSVRVLGATRSRDPFWMLLMPDLATGEPGTPEPDRATGEPGGPEVNVGTQELGVVSSLNSRRRAALLACFIEVSKAKLA